MAHRFLHCRRVNIWTYASVYKGSYKYWLAGITSGPGDSAADVVHATRATATSDTTRFILCCWVFLVVK